jgi:hypothetical protein
MNGSAEGKMWGWRALERLHLAERFSRLQSENASLKRRLDRYEGSGAIDMTQDDDTDDDAQHRDTGLRDLRERKTQESFGKVKQEKIDAEEELKDVHGDFVNPLTLTVNALQTKIDELHALACQVDPVAADAIKSRLN